jgi:hypothetical protein
MKLTLLKHALNVFITALTTLAVLWLVPGALAAIQAAGTLPARAGQGEMLVGTRVISYQGRLLNPANGVPVPDGTYNIKFNLYTVESGGSAVWSETKNIPVSKGLFSTLLGDTSPLSLATFTGQNLWLGVGVGADPEATPRQRVGAVAYALHADMADSASFATSANDSTYFSGHALSEFYRGYSVVQVNQTSPMAAGANEYWFSFGYSADEMIIWRVKPSVVGAKLRLEVESELGANNTMTYWLRVYNTGTVNSGYQLIRYHFSQ